MEENEKEKKTGNFGINIVRDANTTTIDKYTSDNNI